MTIVWSGIWTLVLMYLMKITVGIDVDPDTEEIGLDIVQVGEQAYDETLCPVLDLGSEIMTAKLCEPAKHGDLDRVRALIESGIVVI